MTIDQALDYIHGKFRKGSVPGLHRIRHILGKLGNPQEKLNFVHIAGTNGKGSTAAMSASILTEAGYRTGLFTSPFLYRFNERIQIGNEQIPDDKVVELVERLMPLAEEMEDTVTEFELVTAMAMVYFWEEKCDIVVLECGMGGELDATNIIPSPEVAVITNIGLDHTDMLGDTLPLIAGAKAGIIKYGCDAVIYRCDKDVEYVFAVTCGLVHAHLRKADFDSLVSKSISLFGQTFDHGSRKDLFLPLLGDHQLHNAAVVLETMEALVSRGWTVSEEHIREGLKKVTWPGRFDIVSRDPLFIIDGGHNPQCIGALVKNIEDYLGGKRVIALTGVLGDKDYGEMYRPVMPLVEKFVCITPPSPRKLEASALAEYLRAAGADAESFDDVLEGVKAAIREAGEDGVVLCFGSLYSIGAIKEALDQVL